MIRIPQVRVIDEEGNQLGVMPTFDALRLAQERGYDLVEVAPMASPPVCRLLDFGQYKYELTKREKEAKRKQRAVSFKELRIRPKIGDGDFETKVRRAIEFLEDGDRIKVTVQFRGRELTHPHIGRDLLARFADQVKDHGTSSGRRSSRASRCTSRSRRRTSRSCARQAGSPPRPVGLLRPPQPRPRWRTRRDPCPRHPGSEAGVPKLKSHKGSQKRIGVTGTGKAIRVKSWRGHHLELKSSRRTRRYAGKELMGPEHADQVARLLPYLRKG